MVTELEASVTRSFHSTRTKAPRCPHERAADMNGIASSRYHHWHANPFLNISKQIVCHSIGLDHGAPEEIWSWHKLATVSTRWPCQTNEANKCSICLQQHEQNQQNTRVVNILGVKNPTGDCMPMERRNKELCFQMVMKTNWQGG
jgi:hypothetical protein